MGASWVFSPFLEGLTLLLYTTLWSAAQSNEKCVRECSSGNAELIFIVLAQEIQSHWVERRIPGTDGFQIVIQQFLKKQTKFILQCFEILITALRSFLSLTCFAT
jgi:hypothetical protein